MAIRIDFDSRNLRTNIQRFPSRLEHRLGVLFDYEANYALGWLKTGAPWTDDTGAARAGLIALSNTLGQGSFEIFMSYSVHYGIWLEVANSGKYAIITPAMRVIGQKMMKDLQGLIDGMS